MARRSFAALSALKSTRLDVASLHFGARLPSHPYSSALLCWVGCLHFRAARCNFASFSCKFLRLSVALLRCQTALKSAQLCVAWLHFGATRRPSHPCGSVLLCCDACLQIRAAQHCFVSFGCRRMPSNACGSALLCFILASLAAFTCLKTCGLALLCFDICLQILSARLSKKVNGVRSD